MVISAYAGADRWSIGRFESVPIRVTLEVTGCSRIEVLIELCDPVADS